MSNSIFNNKVYIDGDISLNSGPFSVDGDKRIRMYAGDTLPTGYVWCDGNSGTPDLRSLFVYSTTANASLNTTGSNTVNDFPAHTHNSTININSYNYISSSGLNANFERSSKTGTFVSDDNNIVQDNIGGANTNSSYSHSHVINNSLGTGLSNNIINFSNSNFSNTFNSVVDNLTINTSAVHPNTSNNSNVTNYTKKAIMIGFIMKG